MRSAEPPVPAPEPVTLKGVSILLVEDERDGRDLVAAMLESYGATVRAVDSAEAALKILEDERVTPHILVSDVGMPGTDGLSLVRAIRASASAATRAIPAIAVTAYANPEDRVRAIIAGFQQHVPKPVDANVLAKAISNLVVSR